MKNLKKFLALGLSGVLLCSNLVFAEDFIDDTSEEQEIVVEEYVEEPLEETLLDDSDSSEEQEVFVGDGLIEDSESTEEFDNVEDFNEVEDLNSLSAQLNDSLVFYLTNCEEGSVCVIESKDGRKRTFNLDAGDNRIMFPVSNDSLNGDETLIRSIKITGTRQGVEKSVNYSFNMHFVTDGGNQPASEVGYDYRWDGGSTTGSAKLTSSGLNSYIRMSGKIDWGTEYTCRVRVYFDDYKNKFGSRPNSFEAQLSRNGVSCGNVVLNSFDENSFVGEFEGFLLDGESPSVYSAAFPLLNGVYVETRHNAVLNNGVLLLNYYLRYMHKSLNTSFTLDDGSTRNIKLAFGESAKLVASSEFYGFGNWSCNWDVIAPIGLYLDSWSSAKDKEYKDLTDEEKEQGYGQSGAIQSGREYNLTEGNWSNSFKIIALEPGVYNIRLVFTVNDCDKYAEPYTMTREENITVEVGECNHKWSDWVVTHESNCKENGTMQRECEICGISQMVLLEKGDHLFGSNFTIVDPEGTLVKNICDYCHEEVTIDLEAEGLLGKACSHSPYGTDSPVINLGTYNTKKTDYGSSSLHYCTICKKFWVTSVGSPISCEVFEPTCEKEGYTETREVRNDGYERVEKSDVKEPLGHQWSEWVVVKEPTATEEGLKERHCTRINKVHSYDVEGIHCDHKETEVIPKLSSQGGNNQGSSQGGNTSGGNTSGGNTSSGGTSVTNQNNSKKVQALKVTAKGLKKNKVKIKRGKSLKLKVTGGSGKLTFKSSNKKIATVSKKGKIKAKRKGKVTITIKKGKTVKRIKVTVK